MLKVHTHAHTHTHTHTRELAHTHTHARTHTLNWLTSIIIAGWAWERNGKDLKVGQIFNNICCTSGNATSAAFLEVQIPPHVLVEKFDWKKSKKR